MIIRTLYGGGGYARLLAALEKQTLRPKDIFVVVPHGYDAPSPSLGNETVLRTEKGMWSQRIYGMEYAYGLSDRPDYLLVCDDDVEFDGDFAERLVKTAEEYAADTLVPIRDCRKGWLKNLVGGILGERTENRKSPYKITIKRNGRYSVNNSLPGNVNPTQSGPFACFLMRTDITPKMGLRDEMWLDQTRYAWPDDQVFFFKAYRSGLRCFSCKAPAFEHLDGGSGVPDKQREMDAVYAHGRNIVIFWRRFLSGSARTTAGRIRSRIAFGYYTAMQQALYFGLGLRSRDLSKLRAYRRGLRAGWTWKG